MSTFHIRNLFFVLFMLVGLSSCDLVGDIFEFGAWTILIIVVVVIVIVGWIIKKLLG